MRGRNLVFGNICLKLRKQDKICLILGDTFLHGPINYLDTKANCPHLKKFTCNGALRLMFICLSPPPLQDLCLRWSSNFVGSESGQIQSVKLLRNIFSNRTQHPHPLAVTHCLYLYILYFDTEKGGGGS